MLGLIIYEDKVVPHKVDITDENTIEELLSGEFETIKTAEYGDVSVLRDKVLYIRKSAEGLAPNILCNENQSDMETAGILLGPVVVLNNTEEEDIAPLGEEELPEIKLAIAKKLLLNNFRS